MNYKALFVGFCASVVSAGAAEYRHSFGVGALELFRVKISADTSSAAADPSLAPRTDREYMDGYNRVDSSGNLGEGAPGLPSRTSNFGFVSDSQVDLQAGTLSYHAVTPGESRFLRKSSARGNPGAELSYRVMREGEGRWTFGFEARAGYIEVEHWSAEDIASSVRVLTDTYQLGGVVPQPAPYSGSFTVQPGTQRIGDTPTRSITTTSALLSGARELSAEGWLFRLGVVWQPIRSETWDLQLHGGPAAMRMEGSMQIEQRWRAAGQPSLQMSVAAKRTKWLMGAYAGVLTTFHFTERLDAFAGADLLSADTLSVSSGGVTAKFGFSQSVLVTAGIAYRF